MKKLVLVVSFLFVFVSVWSQSEFRKVSTNFEKSEAYFCSELSEKTIQLYVKKMGDNDSKSEVLKGIEAIRVVSFSTKNSNETDRFIKEFKSNYKLQEYSPFKISTQGINNQLIYLKEKNERFSDLLVVNTNRAKTSLVEIQGDIDLDRIAGLKGVLNLEGLDALEVVNEKKSKKKKQNKPKTFGVDDKFILAEQSGKITVYNRYGTELLKTNNDPDLLVNGFKPNIDFHAFLYEVDPSCIQSINISKNGSDQLNKGHIDILLQGDTDAAYTVCNGMLFFGQNGFLQCIKIDDDCSPELLYHCKEKPLSSILQMEPGNVKSIELTTDPNGCEGISHGEFVVVELK